MTEQQLVAKKTLYEAKKLELAKLSFEEEILEKVNDFRKKKEEELQLFEDSLRDSYQAQKQADEEKINHYLELLDVLINELKIESEHVKFESQISDESIES